MTDAPERMSRAETIARLLEQRIVEQRLPSGHRLGTKQSLRQEFDVAPATISEVVRLLDARGTVSVRPGVRGGVFVASPTPIVRLGRKMLELSGEPVSVADCLVVRDTLDPLVVHEAARYRNSRDLAELRTAAAAMTAENLGWSEYLRLNWALHRRMVQITPNLVLRHTYLSLLEFVESRLQGVTPADPDSPTTIAAGAAVHVELVEAIASEDVDRVERATRAHSDLTTDRPVEP